MNKRNEMKEMMGNTKLLSVVPDDSRDASCPTSTGRFKPLSMDNEAR
jgi:hypothetical protein